MDKKRRDAYARMEMAPVQSRTPIKQVFYEYSKMANTGWNCTFLAQSLKLINSAIAAVGNDPINFMDMNVYEMDQHWKMDKLTEDIRFALNPNPNILFNPYNMATSARELGDLGYKNSELMPLWFDKLDSMLTNHRRRDYIENAKISFE